MSGSGLTVTVVGWAASTPREVVGDGVPYTSFRMATTPRYFDNRQSTWTDGRTEWVTVKAFRDVAFNVAASIRKGDPVLAHGRLRTEEWVSDAGPRTSLVLDVTAVGHDLTRGCSTFGRRVHVGAAGGGSTGARPDADAGADAGDADPWAVDTGPGQEPDDASGDEVGHEPEDPGGHAPDEEVARVDEAVPATP